MATGAGLSILCVLLTGCLTALPNDSSEVPNPSAGTRRSQELLGIVLSVDNAQGFVIVRAESWVGKLSPYASEGNRVTISTDGLVTGTVGDVLYQSNQIHALYIESGQPQPGDNLFLLPDATGD